MEENLLNDPTLNFYSTVFSCAEVRTFRDQALSLRTSDSILLLSNSSSNSLRFLTADVLLLSLLVDIYFVEILIYDFI